MRLREINIADVELFSVMQTPDHGFVLFVLLKSGHTHHVGNSIDQPYEFPTADEAVGFVKHFHPHAVVRVSPLSVDDVQAVLQARV